MRAARLRTHAPTGDENDCHKIMIANARWRSWLLGRAVLGAAIAFGLARAQDSTEPTADELACWNAHNGGAFYNPTTSTCEVCVAAVSYTHLTLPTILLV